MRVENFWSILGGGDAETTRRIFDERADAVPELTRALRPESTYAYLIHRPHPWRRRLSFMGRRLTVGQFLGRLRTEGWAPEQAAHKFDLPVEAAHEANEYGALYAPLIASENAEDAEAAKALWFVTRAHQRRTRSNQIEKTHPEGFARKAIVLNVYRW